jgi:hypothetical protein
VAIALPKVVAWPASGPAVSVGRIVGIDQDGRPLVTLSGEHHRRVARSLVQLSVMPPDLAELPDVAIGFEDDDAERPMIVGWIHDRLVATPPGPAASPAPAAPTAVIDGVRVVFRAEQEIVLECGASSIVLMKDGHVVIKGAQVVSRASGANKIKGATVSIN